MYVYITTTLDLFVGLSRSINRSPIDKTSSQLRTIPSETVGWPSRTGFSSPDCFTKMIEILYYSNPVKNRRHIRYVFIFFINNSISGIAIVPCSNQIIFARMMDCIQRATWAQKDLRSWVARVHILTPTGNLSIIHRHLIFDILMAMVPHILILGGFAVYARQLSGFSALL